jgi:hypothetical protein
LALSIAQDKKLRETIRNEVKDKSNLLENIGSAQMEQEVQKRVIKIAQEYDKRMKEESGAFSSMQEDDIKVYLEEVIAEVKQKKDQR